MASQGFWKDILTEADGETFCPARFLTVLGALACLSWAAFALYNHISITITDWATAYGGISLSGMGGVWAKSKGSPEV